MFSNCLVDDILTCIYNLLIYIYIYIFFLTSPKALNARSSHGHLKLIDLKLTTWAKSLFKRMRFCKRAATTSKPEIPELATRLIYFKKHVFQGRLKVS